MVQGRICVLTTARSGSTWFMQVLRSLPGLRTYAEIFQERSVEQYTGDPLLKPPLAYIDHRSRSKSGRLRMIDEYLELIENDAAAPFGFKVMYEQIYARPEILFGALRRKYTFIHLIRRNYLDIIISKELAKQSGIFHSSAPVDLPTVSISVESFLRQLRRIDVQVRAFELLLRILPCRCLTVEYEALTQHPLEQLGRIADFVGLPKPAELNQRGAWQKTNTRPREEVVTNFEHIRKTLEKSRFAYLLEQQPLPFSS